jgi:hypothetical protein
MWWGVQPRRRNLGCDPARIGSRVKPGTWVSEQVAECRFVRWECEQLSWCGVVMCDSVGVAALQPQPAKAGCWVAAHRVWRWSAPASSPPPAAPQPAKAGCRMAARRAQRWSAPVGYQTAAVPHPGRPPTKADLRAATRRPDSPEWWSVPASSPQPAAPRPATIGCRAAGCRLQMLVSSTELEVRPTPSPRRAKQPAW